MKQKCASPHNCTVTISVGAGAEAAAPFWASAARLLGAAATRHKSWVSYPLPAPVQLPPRAFLEGWLSCYCCKIFVMSLMAKKDWGIQSQLLLHTVAYRYELASAKLYFLSCGLCSHLTASLSSPADSYISSFHLQSFLKRFLWGSSQKLVVKVTLSQNSLFPRTLDTQTYHLIQIFHLPPKLTD